MTLGQNIQNARRAQGLSQEALAEKIGVSRQALGKWEKDTALPGLDNLQALAAALGIGVDALLGAENADPAVPAVTLDALRDLLAARDAEEKRRRRLWGCAGGAAFIVLAGLLAGVALQYERQISALNQNYAAIQSSYAAQQAELSAQISELQDAVRMGEATVLDWRWLSVDKLHRDADKSWMPVQVQVTPRTNRDGVTARLAVRCGDDTQLYEMTAASDGSFAADGIVFTVGSTYELSVQWTADGVTTNETLGTVDFNDEMTEPQIIWGAAGSSLDFGYSVRRVGNKQYRLTLTDGTVEMIDNPSSYPDPSNIVKQEEPFVDVHLYTPNDYVGGLMDLCQNKRGTLIDMKYLDDVRVDLHYAMPLGEIVYDFFDAIKSRSRGYASYDYEFKEYRESDLVKLDFLLNGDPVDALSMIVFRDNAYAKGRRICEKLRDNIPRNLFEIPVQAAIGGKIIARETVKAMRKDVLAKCYGGDITRKKKLLEKQKEGKKKMRNLGTVQVPTEAFMAVLKLDSD